MGPCLDNTLGQLADRFAGIDFEIIGAEAMGFQVIAGFADLPVAAIPLPPFDLLDRRMHADPEYVEITQQDVQLVRPALFFDNVFDDQVVSRLRECSDGAVKTVKEPLAFARGGIVPDAAFRASYDQ